MQLDHERLDVYQASLDFAAWSYDLAKRLKSLDRHSRDQLLGASQSIALNIAEGCGKLPSADRRRWLDPNAVALQPVRRSFRRWRRWERKPVVDGSDGDGSKTERMNHYAWDCAATTLSFIRRRRSAISFMIASAKNGCCWMRN